MSRSPTRSYIPKPGGVAERALALFIELGVGVEADTARLARACGVSIRETNFVRLLRPMLRQQIIGRRAVPHPRGHAYVWWLLPPREEADDTVRQAIVPAGSAPPPATNAPRSVFEWEGA